jgi:hypothetical protein
MNMTKKTVTIANGRIMIDGKDVTDDAKEIHIDGNVNHLKADVCLNIYITGDVGDVATTSGNVQVGGNVAGSVHSMSGDINCDGSVGGDATTVSGDVSHG